MALPDRYGSAFLAGTKGTTFAQGFDFATTIYHQMGINADKELMAPGDRPIEIVEQGKVVEDILA